MVQSYKTTTPNTYTHTLQMPITRPDCHLCFWLTSYRLEVPMKPFLGSINLLEWLKNSEKHDTRSPVQYKRMYLGTSQMEETHGTTHVETMGSFRTPLSCHSPRISTCSQPRSSQNASFWISMEASLHRPDWLNHWSLVTDLTSNLSPLPGN